MMIIILKNQCYIIIVGIPPLQQILMLCGKTKMIFDFIHVGLYIIIFLFLVLLCIVFASDILGKSEIPQNLICFTIFFLIIAFLLYVVNNV